MAEVAIKITALDQASSVFNKVAGNLKTIDRGINDLIPGVRSLGALLGGLYISNKLWEGFTLGIKAVDDFQMSVVQTAATITSLQGGNNIAENYKSAKQYAEGLQQTLMRVDANTALNLSNLQSITFEMMKQGVLLDNNNAGQVESFTRLANAVAVYSQNGRNEIQVRQEVAALMRGEVDQNSQLASMLQRTVDGPLKQQVEKWKQSGTLLDELGNRLAGFGEASTDINSQWSAIKSSFQTAVSVVLQAGFPTIVKDVSTWLNKVNEYLKAHKDEIAGDIKKGWEEIKGLLSIAADVAKAIYNNFEPFAAFFIGGVLVKSILTAVGAMRTMLEVATATRAVMLTMGVISGAGVATAATGAAAAGGAAVAGGRMLAGAGTLGVAGLLGVGLGYAAQPVVRWADRKLYQSTGWNLTGEAMYNEAEARNSAADANLAKVMRNRSTSGTQVPRISLQDSPDQIKAKIELQEKELAAFKETQDKIVDIAKYVSAATLADLKQRYDAGAISTRDYYEQEKQVALAAAKSRLDSASEYLAKEQALLDYIRQKKGGTDNKEYQNELTKNIQADKALQEATLGYKAAEIAAESKLQDALKKREQEYAKLASAAQEEAGQYIAAAETKIAAEKKTTDYLRLQIEALAGVQGAVTALAATEQAFAVQRQQAINKQNEEIRAYSSETQKLQDELDGLNGKNKDIIKAESDLRDIRNSMLSLQSRLALATAQGNQSAISALNQQISLLDQINGKKEEQIRLEQKAAGDWWRILDQPRSSMFTSPFVNLNDPSPFALDAPPMAVGTSYVPRTGLYQLHRGEAVSTRTEVAAASTPQAQNITIGDIKITLPNLTKVNERTADELARALVPKIKQYMARSL